MDFGSYWIIFLSNLVKKNRRTFNVYIFDITQLKSDERNKSVVWLMSLISKWKVESCAVAKKGEGVKDKEKVELKIDVICNQAVAEVELSSNYCYLLKF